jgi:hypothetical protein
VEFPPVFPAQILFLGFFEFRGFVPGMPVVFSLNHVNTFLVFFSVRSALNKREL